MKRILTTILCAAALASCGQGATRPGGPGASSEACDLIPNAASIFGEGAQQEGAGALEAIAASCQFQSADGRRGGEVALVTTASLGAVTPDAFMAEQVAKWDETTETPLAPVEGLGAAAQIATNLPGYQTQIVFRQGGNVVMVLGSSGDDAMSGEQIARQLAQAASQSLGAAPTP